MKIEVVVEEAKKPKRDRPGSASSIRNIEDIQKRQKVSMIMFQYLFFFSIYHLLIILLYSKTSLEKKILIFKQQYSNNNHCNSSVAKRIILFYFYYLNFSSLRRQRREGNRRSLFRWPASRRSRKKLKRSEQRRLPLLRPRKIPVIIDSGSGHVIFIPNNLIIFTSNM